MIRLEQTRLGPDGNCTAACIASILEFPLEHVPDVAPLFVQGEVEVAFCVLNHFFEKLGMELVQVAEAESGGFRPTGYWIGTTEDPSGGDVSHATVWEGNEMVWNPYPGAARDGSDLGPLVAINFLAVRDPLRMGVAYEAMRRGEEPFA